MQRQSADRARRRARTGLREDAPLDAEGTWLEAPRSCRRGRAAASSPRSPSGCCRAADRLRLHRRRARPEGPGRRLLGRGQQLSSLRSAAGLGGASISRAGASGGAASTGSGANSSSGPALGGASSAGGATIGQVAYVSGGTLYVTTAEGNTVKVTAAPGSKVTKTVETHVKGIHPGETVVVSGTTNANGSISADSIRAGDAGGFAGAGLFGAGGSGAAPNGGSGPAAGGDAGGNGSSGGSAGGPALFGKE